MRFISSSSVVTAKAAPRRVARSVAIVLSVFAMLTLNEFVVFAIEGWSGHAVSSPWRWLQPMIGAMLWPFVALLAGRTHSRV